MWNGSNLIAKVRSWQEGARKYISSATIPRALENGVS
jgi:hypothetical protein